MYTHRIGFGPPVAAGQCRLCRPREENNCENEKRTGTRNREKNLKEQKREEKNSQLKNKRVNREPTRSLAGSGTGETVF
jgi:hypothetical protein